MHSRIDRCLLCLLCLLCLQLDFLLKRKPRITDSLDLLLIHIPQIALEIFSSPKSSALFLRSLMMVTTSIQDRTAEFRTVLAQAQKRKSSAKVGAQRQSLLTDSQRRAANGSPNVESNGPRKGARSEFARKAAEIGRGITGTMEKLERLAQCTYTLRSMRVGYRVGTLSILLLSAIAGALTKI